jgi:hypothetical protein
MLGWASILLFHVQYMYSDFTGRVNGLTCTVDYNESCPFLYIYISTEIGAWVLLSKISYHGAVDYAFPSALWVRTVLRSWGDERLGAGKM